MKPRKQLTYAVNWRGVPIKLVETPAYLFEHSTHLEVFVLTKTLLPITNTGYRSHFIPTKDLAAAGGASAFVIAWLDSEASKKPWKDRISRQSQLSLFKE